MRQIVYLSHAAPGFSPTDLGQILSKARLNNRQAYVTGLLLYATGQFFQALEGDTAHVQAIFEKIRGDGRHHGMTILSDRDVATREFGNWAMAANDGEDGNFSDQARELLAGVTCPRLKSSFANFMDYT